MTEKYSCVTAEIQALVRRKENTAYRKYFTYLTFSRDICVLAPGVNILLVLGLVKITWSILVVEFRFSVSTLLTTFTTSDFWAARGNLSYEAIPLTRQHLAGCSNCGVPHARPG
jgi:hypothetical protein